VKRILFPDEDIEDDDKWNDVDAWSWKTDFEDAAEQTSKISTDWLQSCLTSMSPQSQILVIANMDRYVVLPSGKNATIKKSKNISWSRLPLLQMA